MAPRLLVVAELSHAHPRITTLVKYLSRQGWECLVISGTNSGFHNLESEVITTGLPDTFLTLRRLLRASSTLHDSTQGLLENTSRFSQLRAYILRIGKSVASFPDVHTLWKRRAVSSINSILEELHFDVVLSSSSPVTAHRIAAQISRKHKIPWVADYRDLWSQNHNFQYGRVRRFFDLLLERHTLRSADAVVTVTPYWASRLGALLGRDVACVTNGFDPELVRQVTSCTRDSSVLTVVHTGPVYPGTHNLDSFLRGLRHAIDDGFVRRDRVRVIFAGPGGDQVNSIIQQSGLTDAVSHIGLVTHPEAIRLQKSADVLLLFTWDSPEGSEQYPLRMFEYLAVRKPILVMSAGKETAAGQLVTELRSGTICLNPLQVAEMLRKVNSRSELGDKICMAVSGLDEFNYALLAYRYGHILRSVLLPARIR